MRLTRLEVLALLPDDDEVCGYGIEISPSGRITLSPWSLAYETVVEGLPENFEASLVMHKPQPELGPLIHIKLSLPWQAPISFYLRPDPAKLGVQFL